MNTRTAHFLRPLVLVLAALLSACSVGPNFRPPANDLNQAVLRADVDSPPAVSVSTDPVPRAWWSQFNDPVLDALLQQVWDSNLDLQAAAARLAQSRARYGIASAGLYPTVGADAAYTRQRLSEHGPLVALGAPTKPQNLWQANFDASWEIDFWNRQGRINESALAQVEATAYEQEAIRVSLAAEIARHYLSLRGIQERLDIARQNQALAHDMVRLVQTRERNGVAATADVAAARAQAAQVDALIPALTQQQSVLMNKLALATGQPPRQLDTMLVATGKPPTVPRNVAVGLPSELAQRRPDIRKAEALLHAATAAIGAAQADFYPRIRLVGSFGVQSLDESTLGQWSARQFAVGPSIYLPIFEGGRLKRTLELTQAREQEAAINYRKTVLQAWHEIDDALNARVAQYQQHQSLQQAYQNSLQAFDATQRRYKNGVVDYVSVLVAQRTLLQDQLALSNSATEVSTSVVALYKALGGGWDPESVGAAAAKMPATIQDLAS